MATEVESTLELLRAAVLGSDKDELLATLPKFLDIVNAATGSLVAMGDGDPEIPPTYTKAVQLDLITKKLAELTEPAIFAVGPVVVSIEPEGAYLSFGCTLSIHHVGDVADLFTVWFAEMAARDMMRRKDG